MARMIDSEAAYRFLSEQLVKETGAFSKGVNKGLNIARSAMRNPDAIPTLTPPKDSTPVQHGRWVKPVPGDGENYCSVCHAVQLWFYGYGYYDSDYCPNCGACMDAKEELKDGN